MSILRVVDDYVEKQRRAKRPRLMAAVQGIGNAEVVVGQRDPSLVLADLILGTAPEWLTVEQRHGRLEIRSSAVIGVWIERASA